MILPPFWVCLYIHHAYVHWRPKSRMLYPVEWQKVENVFFGMVRGSALSVLCLHGLEPLKYWTFPQGFRDPRSKTGVLLAGVSDLVWLHVLSAALPDVGVHAHAQRCCLECNFNSSISSWFVFLPSDLSSQKVCIGETQIEIFVKNPNLLVIWVEILPCGRQWQKSYYFSRDWISVFVLFMFIRLVEKPSSTLKTHARYKNKMPTYRLSVTQGLISYCPIWVTDIV